MPNNINPWIIRLITPNLDQANQEVQFWIEKGYNTYYKNNLKQVQIKKGGPRQKLFFVRTRIKEPKNEQ